MKDKINCKGKRQIINLYENKFLREQVLFLASGMGVKSNCFLFFEWV